MVGLPMEIAAVEKLIQENSRRLNKAYQKELRVSTNMRKQYDSFISTEISEVTVEGRPDSEVLEDPIRIPSNSSDSSLTEKNLGNMENMGSNQTDFKEGRPSSQQILNSIYGSSKSRFRPSNTNTSRPSEMMEVASESNEESVAASVEVDELEPVAATRDTGNGLFTFPRQNS